MIPRGIPDIAWPDLLAGLGYVLHPQPHAQRSLEQSWADAPSLACLSVRSGFDLLLQSLHLPAGSEILVSAITIPGMLEIIERHGLRAVPLDIHPATLAIDLAQLEAAITPNTRAILIAHLFGSIMPLDKVAELAQRHNLLLIEDCAQAYQASAWRGHPQSDVRMFSFGPIKTATALGGAVFCVNDPDLCDAMRALQEQYPLQSRMAFAKRIATFAALKLISTKPLFLLLVLFCRMRGIDYDELINQSVRGFGSGDLLARIRFRPHPALLRLLLRRIIYARPAQIVLRTARGRAIMAALSQEQYPGSCNAAHSFWVAPVLHPRPAELVRVLRAYGFDATQRASSMIALPGAPRAQRLLSQLVYLPAHADLCSHDVQRLAALLAELFRQAEPIQH